MRLCEFLKTIPETAIFYITDQNTWKGGWLFVGDMEAFRLVGRKLLGEALDAQIAELFEMPADRENVGVILSGEVLEYPRGLYVWDQFEFAKKHGLELKEPKFRIKNISGTLALRNAIYAAAVLELTDEIVEGESHIVEDFFRSGAYNLTQEVGEYIVKKTREEIERVERFVLDFAKGSEPSILVPVDMSGKLIKKIIKRHDLKIRWRWSKRKWRGKLFRDEAESWR